MRICPKCKNTYPNSTIFCPIDDEHCLDDTSALGNRLFIENQLLSRGEKNAKIYNRNG